MGTKLGEEIVGQDKWNDPCSSVNDFGSRTVGQADWNGSCKCVISSDNGSLIIDPLNLSKADHFISVVRAQAL